MNDKIISKPVSKEYRDNYDSIFRKEPEQLSLDLIYEEVEKEGNSQETKPTVCQHWVPGWDATKEENNNEKGT
jgi:hypothetical protein